MFSKKPSQPSDLIAPYIPTAKAGGFTVLFDNISVVDLRRDPNGLDNARKPQNQIIEYVNGLVQASRATKVSGKGIRALLNEESYTEFVRKFGIESCYRAGNLETVRSIQ